MGKITALETQKKSASRRTERVNLFLDGQFLVGLPWEIVVKEKIEVGSEINQGESKRLIEISGRQKILEKVFNFFSYRPRSQKEVRDYLVKKKVDGEEITDIIKYLSEKGYLNDEEFARWWVEQRMTFRPKGWRAIEMELRGKGVASEIIVDIRDQSVRLAKPGEAGGELGIREVELARKVATKKIKSMKTLPPQEFRQKLMAALARRGFEWETIQTVVDEICQKK